MEDPHRCGDLDFDPDPDLDLDLDPDLDPDPDRDRDLDRDRDRDPDLDPDLDPDPDPASPLPRPGPLPGMRALLLALLPNLALAATYEVGPGKAYGSIGAVPWESLTAGDTVLIHARPEPYAEKWVVNARGTARSAAARPAGAGRQRAPQQGSRQAAGAIRRGGRAGARCRW